MVLWYILPSTLVCWFFAYRYLAGRRRTLRGGQPFVYAFYDSPFFAGQRANPTWLLVLSIILIVMPLVAGWALGRRDAARLLGSYRNACPKILTNEDLAAVGGARGRKPNDYGSQYGCRRSITDDKGNTIVTLAIEPKFFSRNFKSDHEAKGAAVSAIDFGDSGLIALPTAKKADAEAQADKADAQLQKDIASIKQNPDQRRVGASPMDRYLDSLPFEGADVHTEKCGVSIDLQTGGSDAEAHARAFAAIANKNLDLACRYEQKR